MQTMITVVETQSLTIEVSLKQALCIETLERSILAQFSTQTQVLRWAIVGQKESITPTMVGYCIEATVQRVQ